MRGSSEDAANPPTIVTAFRNFEPPFDPGPIVRRMLESIPQKYLLGLDEIVLTNAGGLSRERRRAVTKSRRRKVRVTNARGLYHPKSGNNPAWIEIFLDNVVRSYQSGWWLKFGFVRESLVGDVLFHEIGHHIHFAVRPEHHEHEDVADAWKVRLSRQYHRSRYPVLHFLFRYILRPLKGPLRVLSRKVGEHMLKHSQISRAEFKESWKRK